MGLVDKTALIVDDSRSARFALRRYLERHHYKVDAVDCAEDAMRYLQSVRPGVIFLDQVMPGVDGFTVLKTLRARPDTRDIPVVICSSNEGPDFNAKAHAHGAQRVLQKPPNPVLLAKILEAVEAGIPAETEASASPAVSKTPIVELSVPVVPPPPTIPLVPPPVTVAESATNRPANGQGNGYSPAQVNAGATDSVALHKGSEDSRESQDQFEARMEKVSQGLSAQLAEIKVTVAQLLSQQERIAEPAGSTSADIRKSVDETNEALSLVSSRIKGMEDEISSRLSEMRTHLDQSLQAQSDRIDQLAQESRQAAEEEARRVAKGIVMSVAVKISDQLTQAIISATD